MSQDGNNQQNAGGNQPQNSQGRIVTIKTKGQMPMVVINARSKTRNSKTMLTGNLIRKDRATKEERSRILMVAAKAGTEARLVAILTRRNKTRPKCFQHVLNAECLRFAW
ncbi:hypothetical protein [Enterobacter hormaechei]|uniref:hypothetical protein n=1 Tax=Enterobacter hormaechei TaxID=158836 RepID=UPI0025507D3F|nr:hypothetical protein [Enterobacter hormaechei]MEC6096365.1 hypothetical protein [Enterobacter hormaechei]